MPIYVLKRYHKLIPLDGEAWALGRETAFHAQDDNEAVAVGKQQHRPDHTAFGELTLVIDPQGKRVWKGVN